MAWIAAGLWKCGCDLEFLDGVASAMEKGDNGDERLQFSDVAWPGMASKHIHRGRTPSDARLPECAAGLFEKECCQQRDVAGSFA